MVVHYLRLFLVWLRFMLDYGQIRVAAFFLVGSAQIVVTAVNGTDPAGTALEIIGRKRFDDVPAVSAPDGVFNNFTSHDDLLFTIHQSSIQGNARLTP